MFKGRIHFLSPLTEAGLHLVYLVARPSCMVQRLEFLSSEDKPKSTFSTLSSESVNIALFLALPGQCVPLNKGKGQVRTVLPKINRYPNLRVGSLRVGSLAVRKGCSGNATRLGHNV